MSCIKLLATSVSGNPIDEEELNEVLSVYDSIIGIERFDDDGAVSAIVLNGILTLIFMAELAD